MLDAVGAKPKGDPCERAGISQNHIHQHHHHRYIIIIIITIVIIEKGTCFSSDEMFTKIDADNSGELDVQEFMKGCQEDQV